MRHVVLMAALCVAALAAAAPAGAGQVVRTNRSCAAAWNRGLPLDVVAAVERVHATRARVAVAAVYTVPATARNGGASCTVTLVGRTREAMVLDRGAAGRIEFDRVLPGLRRGDRLPTNATLSVAGLLRLG